jgi:poly(A) polymerase
MGSKGATERLRLSRQEAKEVQGIAEAARNGAGLAEIGWTLGAEAATDAALVRAALIGAPLPANWDAEIARGAAATFPIRAADLPELQGPALGARLKDLQREWLGSGLRATKAQLLG